MGEMSKRTESWVELDVDDDAIEGVTVGGVGWGVGDKRMKRRRRLKWDEGRGSGR